MLCNVAQLLKGLGSHSNHSRFYSCAKVHLALMVAKDKVTDAADQRILVAKESCWSQTYQWMNLLACPAESEGHKKMVDWLGYRLTNCLSALVID